MRIKKLELFGFKSFKDRTVIHFDHAITGIVGPNGCGKSNIVDALVWVMGEMSAKHLRGSSMSDVIFAGAEGYAPMGMAEVSLTLENDGGPFPAKYLKFSELMVTRRLHRDGESEYLINKEPARLRDVQEIFMDTGAGSKGFSIIEQGAIGKIITAKPEDRRTLIEEAAGITKFKVRKRESQRKLDSTEQNIVRLQDILGEQKRQLDSLERQAQRADRYRQLRQELQNKDVLLASHSFMNFNREIQGLQATVDSGGENQTALQAQMSTGESQLADHRVSQIEVEKNLEVAQQEQQKLQLEAQNLDLEIRELTFEMEQARRNREMTSSILQTTQARKIALETELTVIAETLSAARLRADSVREEYQVKAAELSSVQARVTEADNLLTDGRREMLTVSQSEAHLDVRLQMLQEKKEEVETRLTRALAVQTELQTQRGEFEKRRNQVFSRFETERQMQLDIMKDVESFQTNLGVLNRQVDERRQEVGQFKDNFNQVASRLYGLENLQSNFEGFNEGVKQVMTWQRRRQEVHTDGSVSSTPAIRTLAELIEVPETYELAMEAALGTRLQTLISDRSETALSAVEFLKSGGKGRSSFATGEWMVSQQGPESIAQEPGVVTLLSQVVSIPEAQKETLLPFFASVVVVDSLTTCLQLRQRYPDFTFVTTDGDCLGADGILTGGSGATADSGLLRRPREIKELSEKREEWSGKLALAQLTLEKLEAQQKKVGSELEGANRRHGEKEVALAEAKKDLERAETELRNTQLAVERQLAESQKEQDALSKLLLEMTEVGNKLDEMREKRTLLEERVKNLDAEMTSLRGGIEGLQKTVTQLQVEASGQQKDVESSQQRYDYIQRSMSENHQQLEQMNVEAERNLTTLTDNELLIEKKRVDLELAMQKTQEMAKNTSGLRDTFEQMQATIRREEALVHELQQQYMQLQTQTHEARLKLEQLRLKEQYIIDSLRERYLVDLVAVAEQTASGEADLVALESEVNELRTKLNKIGDVNLASIDEFDDLKKRHQFLDQQFNDLMEAKEHLRRVIDRINRICSRRFKDTFEQVNERFMKVFPVLFGGGEARLILVEDVENGEMGIDIVSRPPGKKMQNVTLLSGGEKALTAVSLIFAIFLVKPSPFCLLDEVDAPLDDANVFRFNDLVREMAKRSQIILVTHNKHTMKVSDNLYGVTMEEKGVSKMVSVSLNS